MGSFVFRWAHPATDVFVTGTFDDWSKSEKLKKVGDHFEKNVQLADASEKIYYKFVVDGNWVIDHTAPRETDIGGNENNVLTPERIVKGESIATAIMSSAAPESTTAALAADVPLEKKEESSDLPGAFPETPAAELDKLGEVSVNPLPAADGALNPIQLTPGEKIPEGLAAENTNSHVKLDPESYEKSDTLPGGAPVALSSAAPEATTTALAAEAPIETKVPEVVKESQEKAEVAPEASAVPEEVKEKANVESELLDKVKEAPSTSEGTAGIGTEKTEDVVTPGEAVASVTAAAAAVGAAAVAGALQAKDIAVEKATEAATAAQASATEAAAKLPESVKETLPESVQNAIADTTKEETREEVSPEVPAEVKESIIEAKESPEAAANTEAVEEKKAVETELLKEVKLVEAVGEPSSEPAKEVAPETVPETTPVVAAAAPEATPEAAPKAVVPEVAPEAVPEAAAETQPAEPTTNGIQVTTTTDKAADATPPQSTTDKPAESPTTTEKKKKNRLSLLFGKVKEKFGRK
ncbi:hypothetical protein F4810DRAFT_649797 [Camillea tinctor]|nr:hypothetical protein F4810DRAFT_649797 [Camillea tinctor]